jgi:magnesium transporter
MSAIAHEPAAAKPAATRLHLIDYDETHLTERYLERVEECAPFRASRTVTWLNVDGLEDPQLFARLAEVMKLHALTLEDIQNRGQRPKVEDYGDYLYVVAKMIDIGGDREHIDVEQLSLILGENYVITVQERAGDAFDPVRNRIRSSAGRVRKNGADYLAYALLSVIVDRYFEVTDWIAERIERLEEQMAGDERPETLRAMHRLKRELIFLRRGITPMREVMAALRHAETALIRPGTTPYLRDIYEHLVQVSERIDTARDLLGSVQDLYMTRLTNRTNNVMRIIAVFSSIFLPLNFITGVFGMNFQFMPLLHAHWGVPLALLSMLAIVVAMLAYFRRKRWI